MGCGSGAGTSGFNYWLGSIGLPGSGAAWTTTTTGMQMFSQSPAEYTEVITARDYALDTK